MSTELEQIEQELNQPGLSQARRSELEERKRRLRSSEPATQPFSAVDDTLPNVAPVTTGSGDSGHHHRDHQQHHGGSSGGYDGGGHHSGGHDSGGYSGGHDSGGYTDSGSYGG
jgi:hypothetical protein